MSLSESVGFIPAPSYDVLVFGMYLGLMMWIAIITFYVHFKERGKPKWKTQNRKK